MKERCFTSIVTSGRSTKLNSSHLHTLPHPPDYLKVQSPRSFLSLVLRVLLMFHAGGTMTPRQSICAASVLLYSAHTSGSSPHKRPPGMRRKAMSLPTPTSYFYATTTSSTSTSTTTSPFIVSFTKTSTPPLPQPHHTPQWPC